MKLRVVIFEKTKPHITSLTLWFSQSHSRTLSSQLARRTRKLHEHRPTSSVPGHDRFGIWKMRNKAQKPRKIKELCLYLHAVHDHGRHVGSGILAVDSLNLCKTVVAMPVHLYADSTGTEIFTVQFRLHPMTTEIALRFVSESPVNLCGSSLPGHLSMSH